MFKVTQKTRPRAAGSRLGRASGARGAAVLVVRPVALATSEAKRSKTKRNEAKRVVDPMFKINKTHLAMPDIDFLICFSHHFTQS